MSTMYNNTNCTPLSLLPVNEKITASCHTNMLLSIISDVICFVFVLLSIPFFNALSDNFYVSRKLVAVPINFVTQLL